METDFRDVASPGVGFMFRTRVLLACLLLSNAELIHAGTSSALPAGSRAEWVAESLEQNGIPMRIQRFSTSLSVADVITFYREQWSEPVADGEPGFLENSVAGWKIISRLEDGRQTVVQVRAAGAGGAEGFLSIANVQAGPGTDRITRRFPKRSGTSLISSTVSKDGPGKATTILMFNRFSVTSNVSYYEEAMARDGWTLIHGMKGKENSIMFYNKSGYRCELSITRARGRTVIMANIQEG